MDISNLIQIIIAIIMLISTIISISFSNLNIKQNDKTQKSILTNEIIKFESDTLEKLFDKFKNEKEFIIDGVEIKTINREFAQRYLNLYNYIAALKSQGKIDEDLFYSVFQNSFQQAYYFFIIFENYEERKTNYEELCKYYNSIGFPVK